MAIRVTYLTRIAGLTGVVLAFGASAAPARPVALWGCHGPLGQPLGAVGLVAMQSGEGTISAPGACDSGAELVASFSRPDPAGGSAAGWRAGVPDRTVLVGARVVRAITPAAGPYASGVPQRYLLRSSTGTLESINLLDVWATPPGTFASSTNGEWVSAGVDCARPAGERCGATAPGSLAVDALVLEVDDPAPPRGSVAGISSPARDALALKVDATDDGVGLARAQALLDGQLVAEAVLDDRCADLDGGATATLDIPLAGCAHQVSGVPLRVDLGNRAIGAHHLEVRIVDGAGNTAAVYDGEIAVAGPDPVFTSTVELRIGNPRSPTSSAVVAATSAPAPGTVPQCLRPRLSMMLDQRPVRISHGRPVLRARARYRFRGRLTCAVGTVRRNAARGTPVEVLNRVGRRTFGVTGATTTTGGKLMMILSYRSSRTLIFRHRSTRGTSQVRIPIIVTRKKARR